MHRTHAELQEAKEVLEEAINTGVLELDDLCAILIDIVEDIDNLQFGGS